MAILSRQNQWQEEYISIDLYLRRKTRSFVADFGRALAIFGSMHRVPSSTASIQEAIEREMLHVITTFAVEQATEDQQPTSCEPDESIGSAFGRFQAACAEAEAAETTCAATTAHCERCNDEGSVAIIYCACECGTRRQPADEVRPAQSRAAKQNLRRKQSQANSNLLEVVSDTTVKRESYG